MNYPAEITIREDGPREGFQSLEHSVAITDKLKLIEMLVAGGARSIETTAFVRPDRVPQHADAEELAQALPQVEGVRYRGLFLNERGFKRAIACKTLKPEGYLMIASSESFLKLNNNLAISEAIENIPTWTKLFTEYSVPLERLMVSCAFGDKREGRISTETTIATVKRVIDKLSALKIKLPEITYADTTGYGNPESIKSLVQESQNLWPETSIGLHLHDTRGTGMANALAGLQAGVKLFDASVGGLGGCPFVKGAAGNIPTEDLAFLCAELGIKTSIDLPVYAEAALFAEKLAGKPLPGKFKVGGLL